MINMNHQMPYGLILMVAFAADLPGFWEQRWSNMCLSTRKYNNVQKMHLDFFSEEMSMLFHGIRWFVLSRSAPAVPLRSGTWKQSHSFMVFGEATAKSYPQMGEMRGDRISNLLVAGDF